MKGIAGIVHPEAVHETDLINNMLDVIQQGTSDNREVQLHGNIEIGVAGSRIAANKHRNIFAAIDGEIFNLKEVHNDLAKQGRHLESGTAEETIVNAYEQWGVKCFQKIDGDFALMILDTANRKIILARDRIGRRPLFWFHHNNHFIFGSQIKALLRTGLVAQTPARDALSSYFYFGYLPQDLTPIKEVNKLLPSHYLQYNFNQNKIIEPFWSYSSFFQNPIHQHPNTIAASLNQLMERSVEGRLKGGERIGCFLSGGLGSASVAYYVNKLAKKREISSYTVGFENENEEDVTAARLVANRLGINQEISYVTPNNFLEELAEIVWHLDEPLADPNIVATWALAKLAKGKVDSVFSGMGSDELLAGHNRYTEKEQHLSYLKKLLQLPKPFVCQFIVPLINLINKPLSYRCLKYCRSDPWQFEYLKSNALFPQDILRKASPMLLDYFDPEVFLHKFHNLSRIQSKVSSFLYFDVKTRLVDKYMLQYNRLTEANQLVWKTPFIDQHLIEFLASLPEPEHLHESETALFLKVLMRDILPKSVVDRPKINRPHFLSTWTDTPEMQVICQLLQKGTLVETGFISLKWLKEVCANARERQRSFPHLWAVIILEIWFQLMINHPIGTSPPKKSLIELLS